MSRYENRVTVRSSTQRADGDKRAACLLCLVLSPTIVPHRHLLFDRVVETKLLLVDKGAPGNIECQWMRVPIIHLTTGP